MSNDSQRNVVENNFTYDYSGFDYDNWASTHPHDPHNIMGLIGAFFIVIMIIIGTVGNLMVLVGVLMFERLRKSYNAFIASLSATDLLFNVLIMPFFADSFLYREWRFNTRFCKFHVFFGTVLIMCSCLHISLIAINRYILVVHPAMYPKLSNSVFLLMQIIIIWFFSIATVFPGALGWHAEVRYTDQISRCTYVRARSRESLDIVFSLGFVLPCLVVMVCYGLIMYKSKQSQKKMNSYKAPPSQEPNASMFERLLSKSDHYLRFINKHHFTKRCHSYEYLSNVPTKNNIPLIQINNKELEKTSEEERQKQDIRLNQSKVFMQRHNSENRTTTKNTKVIEPTLFDIFLLVDKIQSTNNNCDNRCQDQPKQLYKHHIIGRNDFSKPSFYLGENNINNKKPDKHIEFLQHFHINSSKDGVNVRLNYHNKEENISGTKVIKPLTQERTNENFFRSILKSSSCPELRALQSGCADTNKLFSLRNNKLSEVFNNDTPNCAPNRRNTFNFNKIEKENFLSKDKYLLNNRQRKFPLTIHEYKYLQESELITKKDDKNNNLYFINRTNERENLERIKLRSMPSSQLHAKPLCFEHTKSQFSKIENANSNSIKNCKKGRTKDVQMKYKYLSPKECRNRFNNSNSFKSPSSSQYDNSHDASHKRSHKSRRRNSLKMILVIFITFALTYLPFTVLNLADDRAQVSRNWYMVTSLAFWAGSCTNPIIYGVLNDHFRKSYFDIIHLVVSLFRRKSLNIFK